MTRFSQTFSLLDIFNNKKLAGKLPLVNYKEEEKEDGSFSVRTSPKSISRLVYDISKKAAKPFYEEFIPRKNGNFIVINGKTEKDENEIVEAVFNDMMAKKSLLKMTVNNLSMIRDAVKETEKSKHKYGINSKLYLRQVSMQEIENLTPKQLAGFLNNIMENLFFGDDFPKIQKKYNVKSLASYEEKKLKWRQKVGLQ